MYTVLAVRCISIKAGKSLLFKDCPITGGGRGWLGKKMQGYKKIKLRSLCNSRNWNCIFMLSGHGSHALYVRVAILMNNIGNRNNSTETCTHHVWRDEVGGDSSLCFLKKTFEFV